MIFPNSSIAGSASLGEKLLAISVDAHLQRFSQPLQYICFLWEFTLCSLEVIFDDVT